MVKTYIFKCPNCGSIAIVPVREWGRLCAVCNTTMINLRDNFDLSEIVQCDIDVNGTVEEA